MFLSFKNLIYLPRQSCNIRLTPSVVSVAPVTASTSVCDCANVCMLVDKAKKAIA